MRKSRFTEEQIMGVLRKQEQGAARLTFAAGTGYQGQATAGRPRRELHRPAALRAPERGDVHELGWANVREGRAASGMRALDTRSTAYGAIKWQRRLPPPYP